MRLLLLALGSLALSLGPLGCDGGDGDADGDVDSDLDGDADADADADSDGDGDADSDADGDVDSDLDGDADADAADDAEPDADSPTDAGTSLFERFTLHNSAGPCRPEGDCSGFVELAASGLLRVDRFGEVPVVVHEATVSAEDLAAAIPVLTDPALVALLDLAEPPCLPPTDIFESMELVLDGVTHENSTTMCSDAPLAAARATMAALRDAYLP